MKLFFFPDYSDEWLMFLLKLAIFPYKGWCEHWFLLQVMWVQNSRVSL